MSRWRKIVVDGKQYRWRGRSFFIIQDDKGYRVFGVDAHVIKGLRPSEYERGKWKRTSDGMVTPGDISRYIRFSMSPHNTMTLHQRMAELWKKDELLSDVI